MTTPEPIIIDLSNWTRLPEVQTFADHRGITLDEAIRKLVNIGLSSNIDNLPK